VLEPPQFVQIGTGGLSPLFEPAYQVTPLGAVKVEKIRARRSIKLDGEPRS
jgi:hypothetical protein